MKLITLDPVPGLEPMEGAETFAGTAEDYTLNIGYFQGYRVCMRYYFETGITHISEKDYSRAYESLGKNFKDDKEALIKKAKELKNAVFDESF